MFLICSASPKISFLQVHISLNDHSYVVYSHKVSSRVCAPSPTMPCLRCSTSHPVCYCTRPASLGGDFRNWKHLILHRINACYCCLDKAVILLYQDKQRNKQNQYKTNKNKLSHQLEKNPIMAKERLNKHGKNKALGRYKKFRGQAWQG